MIAEVCCHNWRLTLAKPEELELTPRRREPPDLTEHQTLFEQQLAQASANQLAILMRNNQNSIICGVAMPDQSLDC